MCCLKLAWHVGLVRNNEYYFDSILGLSDHNIVPQTDCMDIYEHQSTKCSQGLLTLTPKNPLLWKASSFSYRSCLFSQKRMSEKVLGQNPSCVRKTLANRLCTEGLCKSSHKKLLLAFI